MIDRPIVTAAQNTLAIGSAIEHHRRLYANQGHG